MWCRPPIVIKEFNSTFNEMDLGLSLDILVKPFGVCLCIGKNEPVYIIGLVLLVRVPDKLLYLGVWRVHKKVLIPRFG